MRRSYYGGGYYGGGAITAVARTTAVARITAVACPTPVLGGIMDGRITAVARTDPVTVQGMALTQAPSRSRLAIGRYYTRGPGYYVGRTYYVWRPGRWAWQGGQRVWIRGRYVVRR